MAWHDDEKKTKQDSHNQIYLYLYLTNDANIQKHTN